MDERETTYAGANRSSSRSRRATSTCPAEPHCRNWPALLDISRQAYTRRLDRALGNYLSSTGIEAL
ncbi:hypothetical protein BRC86_08555 [Halobacteriales archaeon QS_3_64_16]|nr:MAG: hypothetical protein BRC86_08555 [Halobacteriales archaeon QS_3_64_16]